MNSDRKKFLDSLADSESLLRDFSDANYTRTHESLDFALPQNFDLKNLKEWSPLRDLEKQQKPTIRIIQHMACTGGTIICKCIAGMPNVALLSEVNPLSKLHVSYKPKFAPTDLTYLAIQGKFPLLDELGKNVFKAEIDVISKHVQELGKYLVIREHSHSDYLVGEAARQGSIVKELLQDDYPKLCILTVRHPVDSYLSLISNQGWVHFTPTTFDEYCKRYLLFIEHNKEVPSYKYEDFLADPKKEIGLICEALSLPFNEDFQDVFDLNSLSGDSGRSSNVISVRERREFDNGFRAELENSVNYVRLCETLSYEPSIE